MARDIVLLVNPVGGGVRGLRTVVPVVRRLRDGGAHVRVVYGNSPAESAELARAAVHEAPDALVMLGGDGLVHLALQAVAGSGTPLGILPAGNGNDIARVLGIPADPVAACDTILDGVVSSVDAGRFGGRWFASVLCAGFASLVTERAGRMWMGGQARYVAATLAELPAFRPIEFTLGLDDEQWRTEAMMVAVGNTSTFGAGMRICPQADPRDGLFDVTVIRAVPRRDALARILPLLHSGRHISHPAVTTIRARTVSLAADGIISYADGERTEQLPLTCETVPGSLRVLVPPSEQG